MALNPQLVKVSVKYGFVGGFMAAIVFLSLYLLKENPLLHIRLFDFVLIPIMVFFCIKEYRDLHVENEFFFWQGMTIGFFTYFLIAVLSALFIAAFVHWYDYNLLLDFIQTRTQEVIDNQELFVEKVGRETYETTLANLRDTKIHHIALDDFIKKLGIGLFYTIIISVILRRKNI
jgi:hypothetical protein